MEITAFLIIGGVWAVFLLPSFFESHRRASVSSTRSFHRGNDLLAAVATQSAETVMHRGIIQRRRRRSLMILSGGAGVTLAAAVMMGNVLWLGATVVFDIALAAYVTMLLQAKAAHFAPMARVVPLSRSSAYVEAPPEVVTSVRIVAG